MECARGKDATMLNDRHAVWLATGPRTPFVGVDGPFVNSDFRPCRCTSCKRWRRKCTAPSISRFGARSC